MYIKHPCRQPMVEVCCSSECIRLYSCAPLGSVTHSLAVGDAVTIYIYTYYYIFLYNTSSDYYVCKHLYLHLCDYLIYRHAHAM